MEYHTTRFGFNVNPKNNKKITTYVALRGSLILRQLSEPKIIMFITEKSIIEVALICNIFILGGFRRDFVYTIL